LTKTTGLKGAREKPRPSCNANEPHPGAKNNKKREQCAPSANKRTAPWQKYTPRMREREGTLNSLNTLQGATVKRKTGKKKRLFSPYN